MQFTKTLLATALFAVAGVAQASYSNTDEVLSIVDTTNNSAYVLDLGVTPTALISNPSLSVTLNSSDANFSSFESGIAAGDTVVYKIEGWLAPIVSGKSYPDIISTFVTSTASDFLTNGGSALFSSTTTGVSNLTSAEGTLKNELASYTPAGLSQYLAAGAANYAAVGGWGSSAQGTEGTQVNNAAIGSALNLWQINRTGSSAITTTDLAAVNLAITGTGSNAVGTLTVGSVSAVPLPTSVWLFLSGVMGVLSLKRRKNAAV